ncbi:MAG: hypothetical protein ABGY09_06725 [Euryarchaeota archaeon]
MALRCPKCGGPVRPHPELLECEECGWSKEISGRPRRSTRLKWAKEYATRVLREEFDDCGVVKVFVRGPRGPRGDEYLAATVYVEDHHKAIGKEGERVREVEERLREICEELDVPPVRITIQPASQAPD